MITVADLKLARERGCSARLMQTTPGPLGVSITRASKPCGEPATWVGEYTETDDFGIHAEAAVAACSPHHDDLAAARMTIYDQQGSPVRITWYALSPNPDDDVAHALFIPIMNALNLTCSSLPAPDGITQISVLDDDGMKEIGGTAEIELTDEDVKDAIKTSKGWYVLGGTEQAREFLAGLLEDDQLVLSAEAMNAALKASGAGASGQLTIGPNVAEPAPWDTEKGPS